VINFNAVYDGPILKTAVKENGSSAVTRMHAGYSMNIKVCKRAKGSVFGVLDRVRCATLISWVTLGLISAALCVGVSACQRNKVEVSAASNLTGEWRYAPPREYWPTQSFKLKLEQSGNRLTGRLLPNFDDPSKVFEKQTLTGSVIGKQVNLEIRMGISILAKMNGTVSPDGRSIIGGIQYIQQPKYVWSASR
jgi:hypothetical protein